eukprot:356543-Chlamydomonas_euryale.AAC.4
MSPIRVAPSYSPTFTTPSSAATGQRFKSQLPWAKWHQHRLLSPPCSTKRQQHFSRHLNGPAFAGFIRRRLRCKRPPVFGSAASAHPSSAQQRAPTHLWLSSKHPPIFGSAANTHPSLAQQRAPTHLWLSNEYPPVFGSAASTHPSLAQQRAPTHLALSGEYPPVFGSAASTAARMTAAVPVFSSLHGSATSIQDMGTRVKQAHAHG